jgi:5-hydroxyisourate hydrolase
MPGLSIHVIDVSRGVPAAGMRVELWVVGSDRTMVADALVDAGGLVELPGLAARPMSQGVYEAVFHVAEWFRAQGVPLPAPAFLDAVPFRFGIADPGQHYHLPMKITPWGFSLFRGA